MKKIALTLWSVVVALIVPHAHAVDITWNFTDGDALFDVGAPVNFSVSPLTAGNSSLGINATSPSSGYTGASGGNNAAVSAVLGSLNIATSTYYSFTLTPDSGFSINATNLSFGSRSTASGPVVLTLRSSVDGFASDLGSSAAPNNSAWNLYSIAFNVTGTTDTAVEFRLYGSGGSATASNWRIDDITVSASAIPEPATYMLLGLGALVCAQQFRRRKNS